MPLLGVIAPYLGAALATGIVLQWTRISITPDPLSPWRQIAAFAGILICRAALGMGTALVSVAFLNGAFRTAWPVNIVDGVLGLLMGLGTAFSGLLLFGIARRFVLGHQLSPVVLRRPRWTLRGSRH